MLFIFLIEQPALGDTHVADRLIAGIDTACPDVGIAGVILHGGRIDVHEGRDAFNQRDLGGEGINVFHLEADLGSRLGASSLQ